MPKRTGIESNLVTGHVQISQELLATFDGYSSEEWIAYTSGWPVDLLYNIYEVISMLGSSKYNKANLQEVSKGESLASRNSERWTLSEVHTFIKSIANFCIVKSMQEKMLGLLELSDQSLKSFNSAIIMHYAAEFEAHREAVRAN